MIGKRRVWETGAAFALSAVLVVAGAAWGARAYLNWRMLEALDGGDVVEAQRLIWQGANMDIRGREYALRPLHLACYGHKPETVRHALRRGAEVDARDLRGSTPLMYAAANGDAESIVVLIEAGAAINARDNWGYTPLRHAANERQTAAFQVLLEHGANVDAKTAERKDIARLLKRLK